MENEKDLQKLPEVRSYAELRKSHPPTDKFRFKEAAGFDALNSPNLAPTAQNNLNNAFCHDDLKVDYVMVKNKPPAVRNEDGWINRVLEKERKYKRDETKIAHDRLKMIDKKTLYHDRDILSPLTKPRILEAVPRSNSKKEFIHIDDQEILVEKKEAILDRRNLPRSISRKELNPVSPRTIIKEPFYRQTISPMKVINNKF